MKLLIDGVPSNGNDGNMPYLDVVFPLDIEAVEVVRGTNDPRYGLHNIAGNANVVTRTGGNYRERNDGERTNQGFHGLLGIAQHRPYARRGRRYAGRVYCNPWR